MLFTEVSFQPAILVRLLVHFYSSLCIRLCGINNQMFQEFFLLAAQIIWLFILLRLLAQNWPGVDLHMNNTDSLEGSTK